MKDTIRIIRTEGHSIQSEAALNGQHEAKKKGANIVKQWDAILDGRTRPEHREADGQIREVDEPFDIGGEKMQAPGVGGSARNVCNCRCCLLQRAKWALDEDELNVLKERAAYYGLDKTKDFEEFKGKYLEASEQERSKQKYKYQDTVINKDAIESLEYRKRFNNVSDNGSVNRSAWQLAKDMLHHRSGTKYEDLAFIDSTSGSGEYKVNKGYNVESKAKPNKPMKKMLEDSSPNTIIAIHNHPGSSVPSIPDLRVCMQRNYKKGIVVCHDGKVYAYSVNEEKYNAPMVASALDRLEIEGYTDGVKKIFSDAGVSMEVL